jgi:N,N'-diacetylchitobiose transport system substrate-binding protein
MEASVKRTVVSATALTAALTLAVTACSSSGSGSDKTGLSTDGKGKTITVWLQSDAQTGWPAVVTQATDRFEKATGATVKIQWQQWSNYTTKLDSTFAGSTGIPDVVELGNTQTASYIQAGAFTDLSKDKNQFDNSSTWLKGLEESGTSPDGQLQAVPYYAGSRVVIYRKDLWQAAGVTTVPTTLDELNADLDKVKAANSSDPNFSAFYMPGKYWYAAMSLVYGQGGEIAKQNGGKWVGTLESAEAQKGLAEWQTLATKYSVGGATLDESTQDTVMAKGHVAAIAGNGWEVGAVTDPKTGNPKLAPDLSTFPFPGTSAGSYTPSFLGGSDLAVPAKAQNAGLGATWIKYFTDTASQTALAKFAIPNTTSLLSVYEKQSQANQSTGEAAKNTWFVPNTPNWANVESGNILQNMLESIATGKASIAAATKTADGQIDKTLNGTN